MQVRDPINALCLAADRHLQGSSFEQRTSLLVVSVRMGRVWGGQ